MQGHVHSVQPSWISYAISIAFILVVFAIRVRRMGAMRPLKLGSLWFVPAVYGLMTAAMFYSLPPTPAVALVSACALCIGAAVGWWRGKMMHIHVDPQTHELNQRASPAAIMFLLALIVIRSGAKMAIGSSGGVSPAMLTDPLVTFALGMFSLTRAEMYLRARRMLDDVRAKA